MPEEKMMSQYQFDVKCHVIKFLSSQLSYLCEKYKCCNTTCHWIANKAVSVLKQLGNETMLHQSFALLSAVSLQLYRA